MVVGGDEGGEGGGEGGGGIIKSPRVVLQTIKNQKYFSLGPFQGHNIFQRLIDDALRHLPMLGSVTLRFFFLFFSPSQIVSKSGRICMVSKSSNR